MKFAYIVILEYEDTKLYDFFKTYLEERGEVVGLTEHAFLMSSEYTAPELRNCIKGAPYDVSRIHVVRIRKGSAWYNSLTEGERIKEFMLQINND